MRRTKSTTPTTPRTLASVRKSLHDRQTLLNGEHAALLKVQAVMNENWQWMLPSLSTPVDDQIAKLASELLEINMTLKVLESYHD
jgi:hypothetical protein